MASEAPVCPMMLPERLQSLHPGVYHDKKGKTWAIMFTEQLPSRIAWSWGCPHCLNLKVVLRQLPVDPWEPLYLSQDSCPQLPHTWLLDQGRWYRAPDMTPWETVDFSQTSDVQQLILKQRPIEWLTMGLLVLMPLAPCTLERPYEDLCVPALCLFAHSALPDLPLASVGVASCLPRSVLTGLATVPVCALCCLLCKLWPSSYLLDATP